MSTAAIKKQNISSMLYQFRIQRGLIFGAIIISALLAFEMFNFSTTDFALSDFLGGLNFFGVKWATILAIAFCGIDFAGIARLFTPEEGSGETNEVWYLFGAWLLAATMNATLTWWGVSLAIINHDSPGNMFIANETLLRVVPIFVAVMVWLIRVLIIGTFSVAGDRLFTQTNQRANPTRAARRKRRIKRSRKIKPLQKRRSVSPVTFHPSRKSVSKRESNISNQEPSYHPVGMHLSSKSR